MRLALLVLAIVLPVATLQGQEKKEIERVAPRFTIIHNADVYPQAEAKEALESAIKAVERNRLDYLLAHLVDPEFIDQRMRDSNQSFDAIVVAMQTKWKDDPTLLGQWKSFLKEGEFTELSPTQVVVTHKSIKDRKVLIRRIGQRYFVQNERTEPAPKK